MSARAPGLLPAMLIADSQDQRLTIVNDDTRIAANDDPKTFVANLPCENRAHC